MVYGRGRCVRVRVRMHVSHGLADVVWDRVKWVLREAWIARRWRTPENQLTCLCHSPDKNLTLGVNVRAESGQF